MDDAIDVEIMLERTEIITTRRRNIMARWLFVIPFLAMVSLASAQQRADPGCARDVARHCRSVMNDGDMAVLACLKQNRARLSKACDKVLTDHGQ
jgi:hypothetical protein